MKAIFSFLVIITISFFGSNSFSQTPYWDWAKSSGGASNDEATCMATDAAGNVYVAGNFDSNYIVFGSDTLYKHWSSSTNPDIFVVKYNALGSVLWTRSEGYSGTDKVNDICVDTFGNVYITGLTYSNYLIIGSDTLIGGSNMNMFIAKYDSLGNFIWAKNPSSNNSDDLGYGVTSDPSGNVFVSGVFRGAFIAFENDTLLNNQNTFYDIFIVKYDSSGNVLWAKNEGDNGHDYAYCAAADQFGNLFVSGYTDSPTIQFDTTLYQFGPGLDFFILKYDASGNLLWVKCPLGNDDQQVLAMTTDNSGNVLITGYFSDLTLIVGADTLVNPVGSIPQIFVIKYDNSGNPVWARSAGAEYYDYGKGISCDAQDNVYITGYYETYDDFSFGSISLPSATNNEFDIFFAKYDSWGNEIWVQAAGGANTDKGICSSTDNSGNLYLAGMFNSPSINLGSNSLLNYGLYDMFIGKIGESPVGNYQVMNQNTSNLFPNPSSNCSKIVFEETQFSGSVIVTDLIGNTKSIYKLNGSKEITIDISLFENGIYLVQILTENGVTVKKLIKQ